MGDFLDRHWGYEEVHDDEMAGTSEHNENMKDFVGAEVFVAGIKNGNFQSVNNTADGIDDAACQQPSKAGSGERAEDRHECQHTQPSHSDIKHGRHPFGTGDPEPFQKDAEKCNGPYHCAEDITDCVMQGNEADGSVTSRNHNKYHHVVHLSQPAVDFFCGVYRMIEGTCRIEKDHSQYKDA